MEYNKIVAKIFSQTPPFPPSDFSLSVFSLYPRFASCCECRISSNNNNNNNNNNNKANTNPPIRLLPRLSVPCTTAALFSLASTWNWGEQPRLHKKRYYFGDIWARGTGVDLGVEISMKARMSRVAWKKRAKIETKPKHQMIHFSRNYYEDAINT